MIFDFGTVAVMSVILTFITAQKKNFFSKLMQNSVTAGLLLSVIKLLIFISQLEYFFKTGDLISQEKFSQNGNLNLPILIIVKFRPLIIGFFYGMISFVINAICSAKESKNAKLFDFASFNKYYYLIHQQNIIRYQHTEVHYCKKSFNFGSIIPFDILSTWQKNMHQSGA